MRGESILQELSELLCQERAAALRADVDALEKIQPNKQDLINLAKEAQVVDRPSYRALADMARSNVALIQRLVTYYRALAGEPSGNNSYGADGQSAGPPVSHARGVL